MKSTTLRPFRFKGAKGTDYFSIQNNGTSGNICWAVDADGTINYAASEEPTDYPFELIAIDGNTHSVLPPSTASTPLTTQYYTLDGQRLAQPRSGIVIRHTVYTDGTVEVRKLFTSQIGNKP